MLFAGEICSYFMLNLWIIVAAVQIRNELLDHRDWGFEYPLVWLSLEIGSIAAIIVHFN
jgi:hypothetical protein